MSDYLLGVPELPDWHEVGAWVERRPLALVHAVAERLGYRGDGDQLRLKLDVGGHTVTLRDGVAYVGTDWLEGWLDDQVYVRHYFRHWLRWYRRIRRWVERSRHPEGGIVAYTVARVVDGRVYCMHTGRRWVGGVIHPVYAVLPRRGAIRLVELWRARPWHHRVPLGICRVRCAGVGTTWETWDDPAWDGPWGVITAPHGELVAVERMV
ncbi:MAG: hypothetical protein ONB52_21965 [candidate division KSB1 bacterium]|nr:hypothetical protein [candidate division KSB1 bacterium]